MNSEQGGGRANPKLKWINAFTGGKVGSKPQIGEYASRLIRLVERRGGRFGVFRTETRFVTGVGRVHPVENGFAWHPTLGTPYLPGTSTKGAVRTWAGMDPSIHSETVKRLFGDPGGAGRICFLDAVPVQPARLDADVITPHYAGWTEDQVPGDWRSPTPIFFLATAAATPFLFGIIPSGTVSEDDLNSVMSWLGSALSWSGIGAKTATGFGRLGRDDGMTAALRRRFRRWEREHEERIREDREAAERQKQLATLHPIDREIEDIIEQRENKHEPDATTITNLVIKGRWSGQDKIHVAKWIQNKMKSENKWKERSRAKNPAKDKAHQRTLLVQDWLEGK